mgnify:CR=1 FL=1
MVHFVIKRIDVSDPNIQTRDQLALEQEVNSFIKDSKIVAKQVTPITQVFVNSMYVGVMVDYEMTPR